MKGQPVLPLLPLGYDWHVEPKGLSTYIAVTRPGGTHPVVVWDHTFQHAPNISQDKYLDLLFNAAAYLCNIANGFVSQQEWVRRIVLDGRPLD